MSRLFDKLSDVQIRRWIKEGKPVAVSDGGGLTFTISEAGTAAWVLRYRHGGRAREITLGRYPDKTLAKAREDARKARDQIQSGVDVARQKQVEKIQKRGLITFRELTEDYSTKVFPSLATSTIKQRRQHFAKWIIPRIGAIPACEITTSEIVSLVENVGKKSINVAELVLTAISETFKHGIARHVVASNPCTSISVAAICGKPEPPRQRLMLTEEELRILLPSLNFIGPENALATKILLATCTRIGELARAEWSHIDIDRQEWTIPALNSKTGKGFVVPIVPEVGKWFDELRTLACGSKFVLPARQSRRKSNFGDTHFEQRALNSMLHKFFAHLEANGTPVRPFTPHDLRSTARSWLTSEHVGANVIVAERCLNHSLGGLLAIYDQYDYISERRSALERWTEIVVACERNKRIAIAT